MRHILPLFLLGLATLLVSACTATISTPSSGSSLTPLQVLQNSANTMKQLKSAHVALQSTSNVQTTGAATSTPTATTLTTTPTPTNTTVNITGTGDEALPNQEQLNLTVNQNTSLAEIVQGDKVYIQNAQGKWYVLDKSALQNSGISNPFSGVSLDQNTLLALLQHSKITDYGDQSLNGQSLRHINAILDKEGVRELLQENPQFSRSLGQQNIDTVLNSTKSLHSSVDVWIDETKFYLHRTEVKLNLDADTSSVSGTPTAVGTVPASISTRLDTIIDLSNFDEPVTITPPANATPTSDPGVIFGGSANVP